MISEYSNNSTIQLPNTKTQVSIIDNCPKELRWPLILYYNVGKNAKIIIPKKKLKIIMRLCHCWRYSRSF